MKNSNHDQRPFQQAKNKETGRVSTIINIWKTGEVHLGNGDRISKEDFEQSWEILETLRKA